MIEGVNVDIDIINEESEATLAELNLIINESVESTEIAGNEELSVTYDVLSIDVDAIGSESVSTCIIETENQFDVDVVEVQEIILEAYTVVSSGDGDMKKLIYDPTGIEADTFNAGNLYGNLDGGTFN